MPETNPEPVLNNVELEPEAVAAYVAAHYELPAPPAATLLRRGFNDTYEIKTDRSRFIFRIYFNGKYYIASPSDFRFELELLTWTSARGAPVSFPLKRKDGELLSTLPTSGGERYGALFSFAEGASAEAPNAEQAASWGEALAQFHTAANGFHSPHARYRMDLTYLYERPLQLMTRWMTHAGRQNELAELLPTAEALAAEIRAWNPPDDAFGIVHGDPHRFNVHFDAQNRATLFDFDHGGYGYRAWDLATSQSSLTPAAWNAFLDAYQNIRPVSVGERNMIPYFGKLRPIWDCGDVLAMLSVWGERLEDFQPNPPDWIPNALKGA